MAQGKLGFGLMRLPRKGLSIDVRETSEMVDLFLDAGFTYFDTARIYPGSEEAVSKALVKRHPRESYTIATKLFAASALSEKEAKKQFKTSLEKMGIEYVDYYLLHSIMNVNRKVYDRYHLWDFVSEQKEKGTMRNIGFSFHAGPALLDSILTEHPEVDFVQLQINYADWEDKNVTSRQNYEVARKHGKQIVVMEPVKGGALAKPPKEIRKLFEEHAPGMSPASWAIRFAASLDGILSVLSGMSNVEQMKDNISYMRDFKPLNEEERAILRKAQAILGSSKTIPCTACRYCTKGCPMEIPIPDVFWAANKMLGDGLISEARADYSKIAEKGNSADACVGCGQCEDVCPQHLKIISLLKECREKLE